MKKFFFGLMAIAVLACTACKKENPAEQFAGNYDVATTVHLSFLNPLTGQNQTLDQELDVMNTTITLNGDEGAVNVTMGDITTTGTADEAGLHLQPTTATITVMEMPVSINLTFPTIAAPVNGVTSWVANVTASVNIGVSITANGTADQVATKK